MVSHEDGSVTVIANKNTYSEGGTIKCVAVGDKEAGTAALLLTYSTGRFPQPVPTESSLHVHSKLGNIILEIVIFFLQFSFSAYLAAYLVVF